jgi:hypothetical protein
MKTQRGTYGLIGAIIWIGIWWRHLSEVRDARLAEIGTSCEGILRGVTCAWNRTEAHSAFSGGMTMAVLTAPLALVVAHYFVKNEHRLKAEREAKKAATKRVEAAKAQEAQHAERQARLEADASAAKGALDRGEFIHKLGAVGDFLSLLEHEEDTGRIANIRLGAAQALRDLVAKHPLEKLAELVQGDAAVKLSLTATLARLTSAGFGTAPEVLVLQAALAAEAA